jgi:hypothetical protein
MSRSAKYSQRMARCPGLGRLVVAIRVKGLYFFPSHSISAITIRTLYFRPFDCGIHKCSKSCHPPSFKAPECPYSPSVVTYCPCGKHSLSDAAATSYFGHNTKLIRTACTDPIPTCLSQCEKPLEGCSHTCSSPCHTGPCPPCEVTLVRPCRCGSTNQSISWSTAKAETESMAFLCNKPCGALRACGHHQCTRLCCPLANLVNPASKSKKKAAIIGAGTEAVDTGDWHLCDVVCGKPLSCGTHHCEERDHRGQCPPCLQSSFEEVFDHSLSYVQLISLIRSTGYLSLWAHRTGASCPMRNGDNVLLPVCSPPSSMRSSKGASSMP